MLCPYIPHLQPLIPFLADSKNEIFQEGTLMLVDVMTELKQYTKVQTHAPVPIIVALKKKVHKLA